MTRRLGLSQDQAEASAHHLPLLEFADTTWSRAKADVFAALDHCDLASLDRMRAAGLFAHWLDEALQRVGESTTFTGAGKRQCAVGVPA